MKIRVKRTLRLGQNLPQIGSTNNENLVVGIFNDRMIISSLLKTTNDSPFLETVHEFRYHVALSLFKSLTSLSTNDEDMICCWVAEVSRDCGIVVNSVWEWPIGIFFPGTKETQFLSYLVSTIVTTNDERLSGIVCNSTVCMCSACLTWKLAKVVTIETRKSSIGGYGLELLPPASIPWVIVNAK